MRNPTGKIGILDLGSNTVLLLVLDQSADVVSDEARITRLGQGVFASGRLLPVARSRTSAAIEELSALARRHGVERLIAVGTEALRRAGDGAEFLGDLRTRGLVDEVRLTERCVTTDPVSIQELARLRKAARAEASRLDLPRAASVAAVAGSRGWSVGLPSSTAGSCGWRGCRLPSGRPCQASSPGAPT